MLKYNIVIPSFLAMLDKEIQNENIFALATYYKLIAIFSERIDILKEKMKKEHDQIFDSYYELVLETINSVDLMEIPFILPYNVDEMKKQIKEMINKYDSGELTRSDLENMMKDFDDNIVMPQLKDFH